MAYNRITEIYTGRLSFISEKQIRSHYSYIDIVNATKGCVE